MAHMRAVLLTSDRRIAQVDHPVPTRRADQVIVDVDLCGICGSDLHAPHLPQVYSGGFVMGHEAAGAVSWVGGEVEGWSVGQRVAINPNGNVDGTCAQCLAGRPNFCRQATMETALGLQMDGGLAQQMAVYPGSLRPVPTSMTRDAAAWVEPTATALHAVDLAGELTGRTVVVTGGGPLGQLMLRIARRRGAGRLLLVEPSSERRSYGTASGADGVLTPEEALEAVGDLQADIVVEASGSGAASALGLDALVPGGVFVVVGAGEGNRLDPAAVLLKEITVRGSFVYTDEFDEAIRLLSDGDVAVDDLTSVVAPLEDALAAFDALRDASTMKVLVSPQG
jgi:threonine dehydrogenase-like Zn-dependent dehydrogenase